MKVRPRHRRHPVVERDANPLADGKLHNFRTVPLPKPEPAKGVRLVQNLWAVTTTPQQILGDKPNRRYLVLQNRAASASTVLFAIGAVVTTANGLELPPGASFEMKDPCTADFITVMVAAGSATLIYADG